MVRLNKEISKLFGLLFFLSLFSSAQATLITIDDDEGLIASDVILEMAGAEYGYSLGQTYQDEAGKSWEYVGFYHVGMPNQDWELLTTPSIFSALDWAEILYAAHLYEQANQASNVQVNAPLSADISSFLNDIRGTLATSVFNMTSLVSHKAIYDRRGSGGLVELDENYTFDANNNGIYDVAGDVSPFVNDRSEYGVTDSPFEYTYVFKQVTDVPEPQTYLIMLIGLTALLVRRKFS